MKKLGILVLLLAFSGVSCAVNQGGNAEVVVKTAKNNILGYSVPLFPGFKFVPERSFVYESGDVKMGRFVFVGQAKVEDVVLYYKEVLPQQGWEPVAVSVFGKEAILTYVTPEQTLNINLSRKGSTTTMIVQLGPKGEAPLGPPVNTGK